MKLLQAIVLLLLIIILLPVAASCAGVTLLTLGTGVAVDRAVHAIDDALPTGNTNLAPYVAPMPEPTIDPRIAVAADAILGRFDTAQEKAFDRCSAKAGDNSDAYQACSDDYQARNEDRVNLTQCLNDAVDLATTLDCEKHH